MDDFNVYTVGGTVQAGGGIYIPRQADEELLTLCRSAMLAYVLTPRQMGKSSLMVQTARELKKEKICSVTVDLQDLGVQLTAEQWYLGFLVKLEDQLSLSANVLNWWQEHKYLGVSQRLTLFFEHILLKEIQEPIVIFVDEIDTTLSLNFTDDFFTTIRYLYTARSQLVELRRLSFVLIGVATPGDLIRDPKRTPFNIGHRVDLTDFTFEEALPLAKGLKLSEEAAQRALKWVLKWTGGHPYLTQRLFQALSNSHEIILAQLQEKNIDQLVSHIFLGHSSEQDNNLQFVRDMLTKRAPSISEVLTTYRDVYCGRKLVLDEEQSLVKSHLKLSGVVKRGEGVLKIRNAIYQEVFSEKWLKEHLPVNWTKRLQRAVVAVGIIFLLLPAPFGIWAEIQRREAEKQREIADVQRQEAVRQRQLVESLLQKSNIATPELSVNLKAFLDTVSWSLGTALPNGYKLLFSGKEFSEFKAHPRVKVCAVYLGKRICEDAAGRYLFVSATWDSTAKKLKLQDFSPRSQDQAAIELIREKDALEDVEAGRFDVAIQKVSTIWGSLPNAEGYSYWDFQIQSPEVLRSVYTFYRAKYTYQDKKDSEPMRFSGSM